MKQELQMIGRIRTDFPTKFVLHIGRITHNQGTSDQCIMAILQAGDFAADFL